MRTCLLLVALLACALSLAQAAQYRPLRLAERPAAGLQIRSLGSASYRLLSRACDAEPECGGFTADGALLRRGFSPDEAMGTEGVEAYEQMRTVQTPNLWPTPAEHTMGVGTLVVSPVFRFYYEESDDMDKVHARFRELIFPTKKTVTPGEEVVLQGLDIQVEDLTAPLQLGVDESYELDIPNDGRDATLRAKTMYGALRGLESFSQLVVFDYDKRYYVIPNAPWQIRDEPRFQHRGILVDTARHWQPLNMLKRVVDSLSYAKFNTLHWHIVDSQAFPFESRLYEKLWVGSYSKQERYTQDDVEELVEYARLRGIRVMVEFDIPGHGDSWCKGYPELCPSPTCVSPLDPSNEFTFKLLGGLFQEISGGAEGKGLFPENWVHLGGDEVDKSCWSATPRIADWMAQNNMTEQDAFSYVIQRAHDLLLPMGRSPVQWEEVFNDFGDKLDKRTITQVWLNHATVARVVAAGYRAIVSNQEFWYLDHLATTWQQFYLNEPFGEVTKPEEQELILGGEVCMWAETVDPSNILNTIWPRAAAAAERLWSPADVTDTDEALLRLQRFRCLLLRRGIDANPVLTVNGRDSPIGPGGCYVQ